MDERQDKLWSLGNEVVSIRQLIDKIDPMKVNEYYQVMERILELVNKVRIASYESKEHFCSSVLGWYCQTSTDRKKMIFYYGGCQVEVDFCPFCGLGAKRGK